MSESLKILEFFKSYQEDILGHLVVRSKVANSPKILIVGGTHGDEHCGVQAVYDWFQLLSQENLLSAGEIHFLLGNPAAFLKSTRYVDYDLNRSFLSRGRQGTYEKKRAEEILDFLKHHKEFDCVLDIHSVSQGNSQIVVYNRDQHDVQDFVSNITEIGVHFSYTTNHLLGLFLDNCRDYSPVNFAIECGQHKDQNAVKVASYHIYQILRRFKMISPLETFDHLDGLIQKRKAVEVFETIESIIPEDGFRFLLNFDQTATFITQGTPYAESSQKTYKAPIDCYILMPSLNPRSSDHDAGFLCQKRSVSTRKKLP